MTGTAGGTPATGGGTSGSAGGTTAGGGTAQALSVVIDLPISGTITSDTSITVLGRVLSGTPPFTATVNGTNVAVTGIDFTAVLSPPEGAFTITATARDSLGATGQAQRTISIDRSPPVITMIRPTTNPAQVTSPVVTIEGEAGDPNLFEVRVRGQLVPTLAGRFLTDVALSAGRTDVLIEAVDTLGNRTSFTQRFDAPALPPTVTILAPVNGASVDDAIVRVRARVNANTAISRVDIGTGQAAPSPTGEYEADVPLALGQNTIVVRAVDVDGREGTAQVQVQYRDASTEALKVTGVDPENGATELEPDSRVSIAFNKAIQTANLETQFVVKANGTPLQGGFYVVPGNQTVSFSATNPLPEGQTITVEVQNVSPQAGPGLTAPFRSSFTVRRPLTEVHGVVLDETATPLKNVLVEIEELGLSTRTSGEGNWSLFVPGSGRFVVKISGPQLGDGRGLPIVKRRVVTTEGQRSDERSIFLVSIDATKSATLSNATQTVQAGDVRLTLSQASFVFADGRFSGAVTMTPVPAAMRVPPLADRVGPTHLWQLSPAGTRVLAPITVSVPNEEAAPPGRLALFYGYAPEALSITRVGFGRVTPDGSRIETTPPFQLPSLEWFGYRVLSVDEAAAVEAVLSPAGPTGNDGGVPDGSLGWLRWAPDSFDGIVDWVLPRAYAQYPGQAAFPGLFELDRFLQSFVPAAVTGTVRGVNSTPVSFTANTPPALEVVAPPQGLVNPPSPIALAALTPTPSGGWLLPFKAQATLRPGIANAERRLAISISARRGDGALLTAPAGQNWQQQGENSLPVASFIEVNPGITYLTFRLANGVNTSVIEHRIDFALDANSNPASVSVTEVSNSQQAALDSFVRFVQTPVTFTGAMDLGTTTGPTGGFGFLVLSPGASSQGIACASIPAGVRLDPSSPRVGGVAKFQYVTHQFDVCSPVVSVEPARQSTADINVDARLFYGNLTFRDRAGAALPTTCGESLEWNDTGDTQLSAVSARDVGTTEVYIFKADNLSEPVATVAPGRFLDRASGCSAAFDNAGAYATLRLGPQSNIRSNQLAICREIDALGTGVSPSFRSFYDTYCGPNRAINAALRPGDPLVIVAVNYRTGYAGMVRTRVPTVNLPSTNGPCLAPTVTVLPNPLTPGIAGQGAVVQPCTVQNIGIKTDISLYPPELEVRVARRIEPKGIRGARMEPTLVRTGGVATVDDRYLSLQTRWAVRLEPERYRRCLQGLEQPPCAQYLVEPSTGESRSAGAPGTTPTTPAALVDTGYRGLPLEVRCDDLPPAAPESARRVCLSTEPRIVDMPAGVAPLRGQVARWSGTAVETPGIASFPIPAGVNTAVVDVSQRLRQGAQVVNIANLPKALLYFHAVGQSQFGEFAPDGAPQNRRTPTAVPPPPFFTDATSGGSVPKRGIAMKSVYRAYEQSAVVIERYDATREHEFRVVDIDADAIARAQAGAGSSATRTLTGAPPDPKSSIADLRYEFTAALLGPATTSRAQHPLDQFRLRIGSDTLGQECSLTYNASGQTLAGQCEADALEEVLSANDIVYLELYLAGNAENVLWRTNFYGLTRRTDYVSSNSRYTHAESTRQAARTANSRQTTTRPRGSFAVRQSEVPDNTTATVELCDVENCGRSFAKALIRREAQRFRIVSVDRTQNRGPVGILQAMGPDGTGTFATLLPEDYAEPERHDSTGTPRKVFRMVSVAAAGRPPVVELLGNPRGRFESFDNVVWGQPAIGPVSITTGRLALDHTDLAVPYAPSVASFTRSYNNQNNTPGVLGVGWRHSFEAVLLEESPERYVATVGGQATQFVRCDFSAAGPSQCQNDGTHGSMLQRLSTTGADNIERLAFVMTEVSGRRLLFRTEVGVTPGAGATGDPQVENANGTKERLQRRWFLTGIDEGPGETPTQTSQWFDSPLPANWHELTYEAGSSRVSSVRRVGPPGLEWHFTYGSIATDAPVAVKAAGRQWGLRPLSRVQLTGVASVDFAFDGPTFTLQTAVRSTGESWHYRYLAPTGAGLGAVESSNEIDQVEYKLAGTTQWLGEYRREATAPNELPHVPNFEFVSSVREPGQQGVPHVLSSGAVRTLSHATGETTRVELAAYGAANSTSTGTHSTSGTWSSQENSTDPVTPSVMTDSTSVGGKTEFDPRLRPGEQRVQPGYTAADPQGALSAGVASTKGYSSARFPHAGTITEPAAGSRVATVTSTVIDPSTGDVTEESTAGTGGAFTHFSQAVYDSQHRLQKWVDEEGRTVEVTAFDAQTGLPATLTLTKPTAIASDALKTLTRQLTYDSFGRLTKTVDVETGAQTDIGYDPFGRETSRSIKGAGARSPDFTVTTDYLQTDNKLVVTRTYPQGYVTTTTTEDGLVTRSEWKFGTGNAQTAIETFSYEAGRLKSKVDARGVEHNYFYEAGAGDFLRETVRFAGDGGSAPITVREVTRDIEGRVVAETDSIGANTVTPRDGQARAMGTEAPGSGSSSVKTATDLSGNPTKTVVGTKEYAVTTNALGLPGSISFGTDLNMQQTFDAAGRVLTRDESVSGVHEEWKYDDVLGRVTFYKRTYPSSNSTRVLEERRTYRDNPNRTSVVEVSRLVDGQTESETLVVDVRGRLLSRTENVTTLTGTAPATTNYTYDAMGRQIEVQHPGGTFSRRSTFDGPGALLTQVDEGNNETRFVRDALGLLVEMTGPRGVRVTEEHDAAGRLAKRTEANDVGPASEWTWEYPGSGWVHETAPAPAALPDARVTKRRFNGRGQLVEVRQHAGSTTRITTTQYDGNQARLVDVTDGSWHQVITRNWDGQGRPTLAREAWSSGSNQYTYETITTWATGRTANVSHNWSSGVAPTGERWEYDGRGNALLHRVGVVEDRWVRDGLGRLKEVDTAEEPVRTFEYGGDGRLKLEKFGTEETKYGYNARGLVSHVLSPDLRLTETGYEFELPGTTRGRSLPTNQRLSQSTAPESTTTETEYDELGRPMVTRTGVGTLDVATTTRVYGKRGELRQVVLPGGLAWTYGYDELLRLTSITPPANSTRPVETFEWNDGLGRMTRHFAGQTWTYTYGSGETTETTPNGELRKTLVDGRGRAAAVQYTVTAANGPGITGKTLRWDGWDALVGIDETRSSGPAQTQTFTYDTSHRLTSVVRGLASVSYGYSNSTRQPSSKNGLGYGYDALGRLSSVTAPWGVTSVTWEAGGQRLKTLGAETFDYDGRGWLSSVTTPQGLRTYTYDGRGNRLRETMTGSTVQERRFSYDSADRLLATQEWDGHIEAWALRADGAKQQEKQWPTGTSFAQPFNFNTPNPSLTKNYSYRTNGTLEFVTDAVSGIVEIGYTHDSNGQVTQRNVGGVSTTYGWDVDGRLVTANSSGPGLPTLAATYDYDGLGMRRRAQVSITPINGPPVSTIRNWTWGGSDGEDEVQEDGNVTTYVAGFRVGDGINVFSHDGIGSVVAQDDGANTNEAQFSTWGTRSALGTNFGPLASSAGFTGHRTESALALTYAKRRWLDSSTGTWLSRDDVGAASYLQRPNELNPWLYAAGNPTRFTDPDGRSNECGSEGGAAGPGNDVTGNQSGALRRESCTSPGGGPLVASTAAIDERHAGYQRAIDEEASRVNAAAGPVAATVVQTGGTFGGGVFFGIPRAVTAPDQMAEAVASIPGRLMRAGAECDVSNPDPVKCAEFAGVAGETLSVPLGMAGPNPKGSFVDISLDPRLALRGAGELVDACVSRMPVVVPELLPATAGVPGTAPVCVRPGPQSTPSIPSQLPYVTMAAGRPPPLLGEPQTGNQLRQTGGLATGGNSLPTIRGPWLRGTSGNAGAFPKQIADLMRGRSFKSWKEFREEFWRLVAADPVLGPQFKPGNLGSMAKGKAPRPLESEWVGSGSPNQTYRLDHIKRIEEGGGVYDLDNLRIVTPRFDVGQ